MYHTKFAATITPGHLSAQFEGESPEQARRSCEAQLAAYMSRIRVDNPGVTPVVRAFTCVDTDYDNVQAFPRIARRHTSEKWEPHRRPQGFFALLGSLVDSLGTGVR